jgi:tetratricopeptide (TPR) repeat protein
MGETKEVSLTDLLRNPREYLDVEVEFKVYFDATGRNFNPYYTRFNEDYYGNFSAWPIDARLYDRRDYPRPYPFFFAVKSNKVWKHAEDLDRLDVVTITGAVRDVFRAQPWIEVLDISSSGGGLSESDVREVIAGDASFVAGRYQDAARHYGRADGSGLPASVRADILRKKGDAHFRAGDYDDTQDAYEDALRHAPDSDVLKRGVEAAKVAYGQNRSRRRGEAVQGDTPEPAPTTEPVGTGNGVDEVIRLLENPDAVATEVEDWRLELEQRAAALRGGEEAATAVAGSDETAETAPVEPAPEGTQVVEEETPAAGGVAPEGCAEAPVQEPEQPADAGCAEVPADAGQPAGGCAEPADAGQPTDGCAEQPIDAGQPTGGCAEEPADAGQPADGCAGEPVDAGQPTEGCAEAPADPGWTEAPTDLGGTGDQPAGQPHEGCAETPADEGWTDEPADETPEGCGSEGTEETVAVPFVEGNERVMWVAGQLVPLPRLPFFGCEEVTDDDLRAIIEEVVRNPESDVE